jgi:4'-phosphopantetheinyl transferase
MTPGRVHLWWLAADSAEAEALLACADSVLSDDERARRDAVPFADGRRELALSRTLLRTRLAGYTGVAPTAFRFGCGAHGRPAIDEPAAWRALRFSVSHTEGALACALVWGAEIGVDVEQVGDPPSAVAETFFAPQEVADLDGCPPEVRRRRFFELWTLKEAYTKARGTGLSTFRSAVFSIGPGGVRCSADGWRFALCRPTPDHQLAIAVGTTETGGFA